MMQAYWQTTLFALAALGVIGFYTVLELDLAVQVLILAPMVAVLGLPHGALDLPIAEALWPLTGWRRKMTFLAAYLGLAGVVLAIWLVLPGAALAMFLGYSALHFSDDWKHGSPVLRWTGGAATIGAPALLHQEEVVVIFSVLAPQQAAEFAALAAALIGVLSFVGLALSCLIVPQARGSAALEQMILWIIAAILPPLIYFAVYFCFLHSIRHFTQTLRLIVQRRRAVMLAVTLSMIVTLLAFMVLNYGLSFQDLKLSDQIIKIVFIGLSALTVPHMILVDRFLRLDHRALS